MLTSANIDRRSFMGVTAAAGLGVAGIAVAGREALAKEGASSTAAQMPASDAEEVDVVVVGAAGVSGMVAFMHAADLGLNVIGIDKASSFAETNSVNYGGVFALETPDKLADKRYVTKELFLDRFGESCNQQTNFAAIRNMIASSAEVAELVESGAEGFYRLDGGEVPDEWEEPVKLFASHTCDCWDDNLYGEPRVPILEGMLESRGIDVRWGCTATELLTENGAVVGVRYTDADGKQVDIRAKNVVMATGGVAPNNEIVREYIGCDIVCAGSPLVDGSGNRMCREIGVARSKNFGLDLVEFGGANPKATPSFSYVGLEGPLTLMLAANLLVNVEGERFFPEQKLMNGAMFCADIFSRVGRYYTVIDQDTVDRFMTTGLTEALGYAVNGLNPGMDIAWQDTVLANLDKQLADGIEQGWVFKGETPAELAEAAGAPRLAETIERYNGYCDSGKDLQFYKTPELMTKLATGPYYAIECYTAAFNSLGGLKVDGYCRAVGEDGNYIPGLFIVGSDADLWSSQYTYGNTCQGFESMSGYLAAEICAGNEVRYEL